MEFQNIYLGETDDWSENDIESIDRAIMLAMQDQDLNNVMVQYFPGAGLECDPRDSFVQDETKPSELDEPGVQATVTALFDDGAYGPSFPPRWQPSVDPCWLVTELAAGREEERV